MKELTWSYVAGFFDGEGSVECRDHKQPNGYRRRLTRVRIAQNEREVLDAICVFLNAQGINSRVISHSTTNGVALAHTLIMDKARNSYRFLLGVEDFVIVKKTKVDNALEYMDELIDLALKGGLMKRAAFVYRELAEVREGVM